MPAYWKKVLLSGSVVNTDILGSAAIATSKLSGAVSSIASHGLGTAAWKVVGAAAGNIQENGVPLGPSQIVETDGNTKFLTVSKGTAYNKAFGVGVANVPQIGATLVASQIMETNGSGQLITVAKNTAYNKAFGVNATDVAAGNHTHNYGGSFHPLGGDLAVDFSVNNLVIAGDVTQYNVAELNVEDKIIRVASGSTTPAAADGAGLSVDASATLIDNPAILWTERWGWTVKKGKTIVLSNKAEQMLTIRHGFALVDGSDPDEGIRRGDFYFTDGGELYISDLALLV